jgi:hypothetical protein
MRNPLLGAPPYRSVEDVAGIRTGSDFEDDYGRLEVVYLGDFHGMTEGGRNLFGMKVTGGGYPELRDRRQRDVPMFEAKYPQFRGKTELALLPEGPWVSGAGRKQLEPTSPAPR